jgi:hypothetical protein
MTGFTSRWCPPRHPLRPRQPWERRCPAPRLGLSRSQPDTARSGRGRPAAAPSTAGWPSGCGYPHLASGRAQPSRARAGSRRRRLRRSRPGHGRVRRRCNRAPRGLDGLSDRPSLGVALRAGADVVEPQLHAVERSPGGSPRLKRLAGAGQSPPPVKAASGIGSSSGSRCRHGGGGSRTGPVPVGSG